MRVTAGHHVGTGVDERPRDPALVAHGAVGVLRAPVRERDHHVDPGRQVGHDARDPVEVAAVEGAGAGLHAQPQHTRPAGPGAR